MTNCQGTGGESPAGRHRRGGTSGEAPAGRPGSAPPRQDSQRCHSPVSTGNGALPSVSPSATGLTAVPRSRHRREQGGFLRLPLRDRTHSGATVPSARETGLFPPSTPPRQDPQRCHGPVTAGKQHSGAGLPIGWRRSRGILAQVRKNGGVLRRETASSAFQWRRTQREKQTCSAWPGDLRHRERGLAPEGGPAPPEGRPAPPGEGTGATRRRTGATSRRDLRRETASSASQWRRTQREKQTCSAWPGDLRHRERGLTPEGGPAPPEGRSAPPAEGTAASRRDLRHRERGSAPPEGGPAPPGEGTCATGRGGLHRKEDLRHRERGLAPEGGPAPPGEGSCSTGRRTGATRRRDLLLRGRT